ncbi:MAG: hypothetical protein AAF618_04210 [Pseudomonadota bacterium]
MAAFLSLNVALALMALALGTHWVEWHFREAPDAASRASAFQLGANVHVASALAAFAAQLAPLRLTAPIITGLLGSLAFSGALYGFAVLGWSAGMPGTVLGAGLLAASWIWIAVRFARAGGT